MSKKNAGTLSADALSVFCSQLALMLRAGIGTEEAVSTLWEDARTPSEKELLERVHSVMLEGAPLSRALEAAGPFPGYLIRMVEIGQTAGRLDQVLSALAAYYRRDAETSAAIRRAVIYPVVMAVLVALVFLVLISRVLPVFQQVFLQLGVTLSPVARGLLMAGEAGKYIGAAALFLLLVCGTVLLVHVRRHGGISTASGILSRSEAGRAVDRSRFVSAMALMLSSGLPLEEAVERSRHLLEDSALSGQLQACAGQVAKGGDFAKSVADCGLLSGLQAGLLAAGFRAGVPEQAMEELADRCQTEAETRLSGLLSRMEFGLVAVLCGAVGLVLLSVMLPLLGVLSAIG